jgi:hypothetical protein
VREHRAYSLRRLAYIVAGVEIRDLESLLFDGGYPDCPFTFNYVFPQALHPKIVFRVGNAGLRGTSFCIRAIALMAIFVLRDYRNRTLGWNAISNAN